jgi:cellulose synthase/poly-beta-1,6-N-acetylglucosamine synthase-like glycosyltransferase
MIPALQILLWFFVGLYCAGLFLFLAGLHRAGPKREPFTGFVSVIIAARNEEDTLRDLLTDLTEQTFPKECFEVIIVNDRSSDRTGEIIRHFTEKHSHFHGLTVKASLPNLTAKKNALTQGIERSRGTLLLTVDADCRVLPTWVETMASYFTGDTGMVAGFSQLGLPGEDRPLFEKLQALDFLALMAASRGSINMGLAWSASGQNLAYRKAAYNEVGGFRDIGHRMSGDDVLLMQLIYKRTRWNVRFASAPESFNTSQPERTVRGLLHQRARWASNGAYQVLMNPPFFLYVIATFAANLLILSSIILALLSKMSPLIPLSGLAFKLTSELLIMLKGTGVFKRRDLRSLFPIWFLLQIPYVVLVGILGNLGRITWKGRTVKTVWRPE